MRSFAIFGCALTACLFIGPAALAQEDGPEWVEEGDAGSLPNGAQNTTGKGTLAGLRGGLGTVLDGGDFEDMYWIFIEDPGKFTASTSIEFNGFTEFDSQLWLFQPSFAEGAGGVFGFGLLANDDMQGDPFGGSLLLPISNDGSNARIAEAGHYLLAISRAGNSPLSAGGEIFFMKSPFEISGPDGKGGQQPISGWTGEGDGTSNTEYRIRLTGATFANLPSPGALALLGASALFAKRRRRA